MNEDTLVSPPARARPPTVTLLATLVAAMLPACAEAPEEKVHEPYYSPGRPGPSFAVSPATVSPDLPCLPASDPRLLDLLREPCMTEWRVVGGPTESNDERGPRCSYSARYVAVERCQAAAGRPFPIGGAPTRLATVERLHAPSAGWARGLSRRAPGGQRGGRV